MIIGTCRNGMKCIYDTDDIKIETVEEFDSLIYQYNENPVHREELQGQPKLLGFVGPMFNGYTTLKSTGETVAIIRYERPREAKITIGEDMAKKNEEKEVKDADSLSNKPASYDKSYYGQAEDNSRWQGENYSAGLTPEAGLEEAADLDVDIEP